MEVVLNCVKNDVWRRRIYGKGGYGLVVWKREKDIILKKKTKVSWKSLCNREMRIYFVVEGVVFDEKVCLDEIFFWDSTRLKAFVSKIKKENDSSPWPFFVFGFSISNLYGSSHSLGDAFFIGVIGWVSYEIER